MQKDISLTPINLDVSTAIKLTKNEGMFKEKSLMARNDVWHKIKILHGAKYDREYLLKAILDTVDPADLIPVRYRMSAGGDTCFIARNCGPAIERLCKNNLIIKVDNNDPIILQVTLGFASIHDLKVSLQPLILSSLTKRYDPNKKSLNLENFHRNDDLAKHVYCPLSQTRIFSHVLKLTKTTLVSFEHLNLRNNELISLAALENSNLTSIKGLDLRNNYLLGMETLTPLRSLTITELWLDGNPLCENYSSAEQYIESAKKYCSHLTKLDGIQLENKEMPSIVNSFFPNKNVEDLVKQFVQHFFSLHDQKDKSDIDKLYDKNAMYSLTFGASDTSNKSNFAPYFVADRNLNQEPDFHKNHTLLRRGPDGISRALKKLPDCIHDINNLKYDVMYSDRHKIVFTIGGVLVLNPKFSSQMLSFDRTFVLLAQSDNEYKILNDQYHLNDKVPENISIKIPFRQPESMESKEKNDSLMRLMKVSTMNSKWATKFLEDSNWNLKDAIINFMNRYNSSRLPTEAFT